MILLGHIGITLFFGGLFSLLFIPLLIGSILPDLIDKPLVLFGITQYGRYIGHTLTVGIIISLISFAITRKKLVPVSLFLGYLFHLLEDMPFFVPWFYPFVKYDFPTYYVFSNSFTAINIAFEIIGVTLIIYVVKKNPQIKSYLTKNLKFLKK
jgi:uncharacterized membrane protein required for colicin V production